MKIALPVEQVNGLDSEIAPNLRTAPALLIVDTDHDVTSVNTSASMCAGFPTDVDILIYSDGMGRGMFNNLIAKGVRIFHTEHFSVHEALNAFANHALEEVHDAQCCGGGHHHNHAHQHAHGCCHSESSEQGEESQGQCCGGHH